MGRNNQGNFCVRWQYIPLTYKISQDNTNTAFFLQERKSGKEQIEPGELLVGKQAGEK